MNLRALYELGKSFPAKAPPVPLIVSGMGQVGHLENRRGLYINSALRRHVLTALRDQARAERAARELSRGQLGTQELLPVLRAGSDRLDAVRAIKGARALIDSWNDVINARCSAGKSWDAFVRKVGLGSVAPLLWRSLLLVAGVPPAASFTGIPGGAQMDSNTVGAVALPMTLGSSDKLYCSAMSLQFPFQNPAVMVADVLVNAANISATVTTTQIVNSTALPRFTNGEGVLMTFEVTTALGTTAQSITLTYTDQAGNAGHTAIQALTTAFPINSLMPSVSGPAIQLASGDYGVRSVQNALMSGSMGAGALALLLFRPIAVMTVADLVPPPTVEVCFGATHGGFRELTPIAGGSKPFIGLFAIGHWLNGNVNFLIMLMEFAWG